MALEHFNDGPDSAREKLNRIVEDVAALKKLRGDEVFIAVRGGTGNGGYTVALDIDAVLARVPKLPRGGGGAKFYALIGASPSVVSGGANRWQYAWAEAECLGDHWGELADGRSGTTSSDPAYNRFEAINSATGVQGNGVNVADLLGTFAIQPIPDGVVVEMDQINVDGTLYYWFAAMNGVTGGC